ncbi:MAG: hypothetical protein E6R07_11880 [Nevskiaceae bacterium]|nr:MAG: hypothetical protein E6R07_11880 [Nevskiaceae bacterium]
MNPKAKQLLVAITVWAVCRCAQAQFMPGAMNFAPSDALSRAVTGFVPVDSTALKQRYVITEEYFDGDKRQYTWKLRRKTDRPAEAAEEHYVAEFSNDDGIVLFKCPLVLVAQPNNASEVIATTQTVPSAESMASYRTMRVVQFQ